MHEMSIVEALIEHVGRAQSAHRGATVQTVQVRVGKLRQVVPDSLKFCYDVAVRGTALDGSRLAVEELPARARCRACHAEFAVEENWFECPRCGMLGAEVLQGNELDVMSIDLNAGD